MQLLVLVGLLSIVMSLIFGYATGMFSDDADGSVKEEPEPDYSGRSIYDFVGGSTGRLIQVWRARDDDTVNIVGFDPIGPPSYGPDPLGAAKDAVKKAAELGSRASINRIGHPLREGNLLRLEHKLRDVEETIIIDWEIVEISHYRDPRDMFQATLKEFNWGSECNDDGDLIKNDKDVVEFV